MTNTKAKQGWSWLKPWTGIQMSSCRSTPVGGTALPIFILFFIVDVTLKIWHCFKGTNSTYFMQGLSMLKIGFNYVIILWLKFPPQNNAFLWLLVQIQCIFHIDSTSQYVDKSRWNNFDWTSLWPARYSCLCKSVHSPTVPCNWEGCKINVPMKVVALHGKIDNCNSPRGNYWLGKPGLT